MQIIHTLTILILSSLIILGCETTQIPPKTTNNEISSLKTNNLEEEKIEEEKIEEEKIEESKSEKLNIDRNKIIKVGLLLPLNGKHYRIGQSLLKAAELALYKTKNPNIRIFVRDTSDIGSVTKAYYEFQDLEIDVILGPVFSDKVTELKSLSLNDDRQIITFSNNLNVSGTNVYTSGITLKNEIEIILNFALKKNYNKFSIIAPDNSYGKEVVNHFHNFLSDRTGTINKEVFFNIKNPDFYEVAKKVSDYANRHNALLEHIEFLKTQDTEESKKQIKLLKKEDTYGELNFDALFIVIENFQQLSLLSSTLPYYDVDPKKIQYFGTHVWDKTAIVKEPGLSNSIFVTLDKNKVATFKDLYKNIYDEKPHSIAVYAFDSIGLISSLQNKNLEISAKNILSENGFNGLSGTFKFDKTGSIHRSLKLYQCKNEKIIEIDN